MLMMIIFQPNFDYFVNLIEPLLSYIFLVASISQLVESRAINDDDIRLKGAGGLYA
jgi:hypothetical protein